MMLSSRTSALASIAFAALGASRMQLIAPLLRESLVVGLLSGLLGYGVAAAGLEKLSQFRPSLGGFFPSPQFDVRPDLLVFAATLAIALVVGLAVGLAPALRAASDGLSGSLHRETAAGGPRKTRIRNALVVIQMAIATVVLVAVGLAVHSLLNLRNVPLGFSARHLLYTGVNLTQSGYDAKTGPAAYERIRHGKDPVAPTPEISTAYNFLALLHGDEPTISAARALNVTVSPWMSHSQRPRSAPSSTSCSRSSARWTGGGGRT
jgi:hypothetical protein